MNIRIWLAGAVLLATIPTIALAQGPVSPTAPRAGAGTGTAGAPPDGKVAVINTSVFGEKILELKAKADVVNKKYEPRFKELETMKGQMDALGEDIKKQASVAAPDKLQTMRDQYTQMQTTLKRKGEDLQAEYNKEAEVAINPVRQKLEDFVKDYATKRNIVLILDLPGSYQSGIIGYFNATIDITDDFCSEYNRSNPVPGAAAAPARPGGGR
ncbi:MAG TPA: OmpH family outer membrane protein [Blastocatellia bacterium]|nr:OmpH family outer membrane protein [Blastocatellia bacterium]